MNKLVCGALLALLMLPRAGALSAQAAIVIDADTGAVLREQNADACLPMASTTKIMTALVALGEGSADRIYTVKKAYTQVEGSSMYLQEGEKLTLRDTLYGLMLASGNDAAVAIAGECGGMEAFVRKMNDKAASLGLTSTHFDNPNGLPSDTHYTTARELAKLTAERPRADEPQPPALDLRRRDRRQDRLHPRRGALSGLRGGAERPHDRMRHAE